MIKKRSSWFAVFAQQLLAIGVQLFRLFLAIYKRLS